MHWARGLERLFSLTGENVKQAGTICIYSAKQNVNTFVYLAKQHTRERQAVVAATTAPLRGNPSPPTKSIKEESKRGFKEGRQGTGETGHDTAPESKTGFSRLEGLGGV